MMPPLAGRGGLTGVTAASRPASGTKGGYELRKVAVFSLRALPFRNRVRLGTLEYFGLRGEGSTPVPLPPPDFWYLKRVGSRLAYRAPIHTMQSPRRYPVWSPRRRHRLDDLTSSKLFLTAGAYVHPDRPYHEIRSSASAEFDREGNGRSHASHVLLLQPGRLPQIAARKRPLPPPAAMLFRL
jgi:hypothetical protein